MSGPTTNADQIEFWNGAVGERWAAYQEMLDRAIQPFGDAALARAAAGRGQNAIDLGCGCGATALALAEAVGSSGRVLGVDISAPMLARARERCRALPQARFVEADATTYAFESEAADLAVSRFGVMFFREPVVAFQNARRALRRGGRLVFVCWRTPADNPWVSVPLDAALTVVPPPPPVPPGEPGPFAFADDARVRDILARAGFAEVALERFDAPLRMSAGPLEDAVDYVFRVGPTARLLADADEPTRERVRAAVRGALAPYAGAGGVALPGSTWIVSARRGE